MTEPLDLGKPTTEEVVAGAQAMCGPITLPASVYSGLKVDSRQALTAAYPLLATRLEGAIERALSVVLSRYEGGLWNGSRDTFWSTLQSTLKGETQ